MLHTFIRRKQPPRVCLITCRRLCPSLVLHFLEVRLEQGRGGFRLGGGRWLGEEPVRARRRVG